jgi:hypothetical protein
MTKSIIIILALLTTSCIGTASPRQRQLYGTDREKVIRIAKQELERRNLALPDRYDVVVENGKITNEIDNLPREVYGVWFLRRGNRGAVYSVLIDKRSGKIDQVSDLRTVRLQAF